MVECYSVQLFPSAGKGAPDLKVMRAFVKYLRTRGIRCLLYLDDLAFFISGSQARALRARDIIDEALRDAGLIRKASKGVWEPTQCLPDHLGICINSVTGTFSAPARRLHTIASLAKDLLCRAAHSCRQVPTRLLRTFGGTATSLSPLLALHVSVCALCMMPSTTLSLSALCLGKL
jgi:hypothetical protein